MSEEAEIKGRAMRLLAMREHSRAELRGKLSGFADDALVEAVLDRLAELELQSDVRFAEAYVRAKGRRLGVLRLKHELEQRGVARDLIEAALSRLSDDGDDGSELIRARQVWQKKYRALPEDMKEWAKQARFLQSRGFAPQIIRQVLKESLDESAQGQ